MTQVWDDLHKIYTDTDWINKPNIFAKQAIDYLPKGGDLLDIGCGQGQDSRYFAENGFQVVGVDLSDKAIAEALQKTPAELQSKVNFVQADVQDGLKFEDASFDVVYAHLSLHYFDSPTTQRIFKEVSRVLKPAGIFCFFMNSTTDPEYGQGEQIEEDYFFIDDKAKRYFSVESAQQFAAPYFNEILVDDQGETYKDAEKGIHNLIRYIGKKRGES